MGGGARHESRVVGRGRGGSAEAAVPLFLRRELTVPAQVRRTHRDKFDMLLDERDARLRAQGRLVAQRRGVYGVNENLLRDEAKADKAQHQ